MKRNFSKDTTIKKPNILCNCKLENGKQKIGNEGF